MIVMKRTNVPVQAATGDFASAARSWLFPVVGLVGLVGLMWYMRKR